MKIRIAFILIMGLFMIFPGCKKESEPITYDCTGLTPTYDLNVKSLMDTHCATAGCHSAANKADGKDLSTYASTKSAASNTSFWVVLNTEVDLTICHRTQQNWSILILRPLPVGFKMGCHNKYVF
ncbi:MAG: hypothetical protein IPK62_11965 [Bacteroidetes bacterium]|nr:hypothetical protein [Bacteroidota bacterium]